MLSSFFVRLFRKKLNLFQEEGSVVKKQKRYKEENMKLNKLYGYTLTPSMHTLSIKSNKGLKNLDENVKKCVENYTLLADGDTIKAKINPNKLIGDLFTYQEFDVIFQTILNGMQIDVYEIVRADMRFDSYDREHYRTYAKLNRCLISLLAIAYKVENNYKSCGLFSQRQLTVAIKNSDFEIENYDRDAKNKVTHNTIEPAKSRLEERSKAHNNNCDVWTSETLKEIFVKQWFTRWDKAIKCRKEMEDTYNDNLVKIYNEDKNTIPVVFSSLSEFLRKYQDCIFSSRQMVDLLTMLNINNPKKVASNFKSRYKIEYFSKSDIEYAINEVKRATIEYFSK